MMGVILTDSSCVCLFFTGSSQLNRPYQGAPTPTLYMELSIAHWRLASSVCTQCQVFKNKPHNILLPGVQGKHNSYNQRFVCKSGFFPSESERQWIAPQGSWECCLLWRCHDQMHPLWYLWQNVNTTGETHMLKKHLEKSTFFTYRTLLLKHI